MPKLFIPCPYCGAAVAFLPKTKCPNCSLEILIDQSEASITEAMRVKIIFLPAAARGKK